VFINFVELYVVAICEYEPKFNTQSFYLKLIVPDVPHVTVLPVYSDDGRISAAKIMITNNQTVSIVTCVVRVSYNRQYVHLILFNICRYTHIMDSVCLFQATASHSITQLLVSC
jgi:hypothetical protein